MSFNDIIKQVMQGIGATVPDDEYKLPDLPAEPVRQDSSPVPQSAYSATPLSNEIAPGNSPTSMVTPSGDLSSYAQSRLDNPALGFDTGGIGGAIKAYHGSPHLFDRFDMSKIGSGEGNQSYSRGLYFAEREGTARDYRNQLSQDVVAPEHAAEHADLEQQINAMHQRASSMYDSLFDTSLPSDERVRRMSMYDVLRDNANALQAQQSRLPTISSGHMYEVNLGVDPGQLLDWDKTLGQQSSGIQRSVRDLGFKRQPNMQGAEMYTQLRDQMMRNGSKDAAERAVVDKLTNAGIPGLQYLDSGSRAAGQGSHNIVMYNDKLIDIMRRYGIAGMAGGGAAAAALPGQQDQTQ